MTVVEILLRLSKSIWQGFDYVKNIGYFISYSCDLQFKFLFEDVAGLVVFQLVFGSALLYVESFILKFSKKNSLI